MMTATMYHEPDDPAKTFYMVIDQGGVHLGKRELAHHALCDAISYSIQTDKPAMVMMPDGGTVWTVKGAYGLWGLTP